MAEINIVYNTVTKEMVCTLDGAKVPDVVGCHLGQRWDSEADDPKYAGTIIQRHYDKDNDLNRTTYTEAAVTDDKEVLGDIADYLKKGGHQ